MKKTLVGLIFNWLTINTSAGLIFQAYIVVHFTVLCLLKYFGLRFDELNYSDQGLFMPYANSSWVLPLWLILINGAYFSGIQKLKSIFSMILKVSVGYAISFIFVTALLFLLFHFITMVGAFFEPSTKSYQRTTIEGLIALLTWAHFLQTFVMLGGGIGVNLRSKS